MAEKVVKVVGGIGNQMFQYAFAYVLAQKLKTKVLLDLSWFEEENYPEGITPREFELDIFNVDYQKASKEDLNKIIPSKRRSKFQRFLWETFKINSCKPSGNSFVETVNYIFNKHLLTSDDYFYYDGYFQNEKYFKDYRNGILNSFSLKLPLDDKNNSVLDIIKSTNSVSIHVRRGDYVSLDCASKFHGLCSLYYYAKAIKHIAKKVKNPHFFLFSDDIAWVVENLKIGYPYTVIDFNGEKSFFDMELMKNCKHNIVANSSFSWWGAWLNQNPKKIVVSPKKWIAKKQKCDIIPKEWVKV